MIYSKARNQLLIVVLVVGFFIGILYENFDKSIHFFEEEQLKIVEKIIEEVKAEEEEAARLAKEAETKGFEESTRPSMSVPTLGGAKDWYFYNDQLKTQGAQQFKQKWGKRVLEDNWRRANKVSTGASFDELERDRNHLGLCRLTAK